MHKIRKNDNVQTTANKGKDKNGKMLHVDAAKDRVIVEGRNMVQKYQGPSPQDQNSGIMSREDSIHVSNMTFLVSGERMKVGSELKDGKRVRVARKGGKVIDQYRGEEHSKWLELD